jgi:hypothetical protein
LVIVGVNDHRVPRLWRGSTHAFIPRRVRGVVERRRVACCFKNLFFVVVTVCTTNLRLRKGRQGCRAMVVTLLAGACHHGTFVLPTSDNNE